MTEVPAVRPDNVPEKFWDAAAGAVNSTALLASYSELERKQSGTPAAVVPPVVAPRSDGLSIVAEVAPAAGSALEAAYTKSLSGALTEVDYASLAKSGMSKANVDSHIEGRNAVFEGVRAKVYGIAGSEAAYKNMVTWAAANLSAGEASAYNDAMATRNIHTMGLAVAGLKAKFTGQFGTEGKQLEANGGSLPAGVAPYASKQDWFKDTGSVEYRTSQTFRDSVEKRRRASKI